MCTYKRNVFINVPFDDEYQPLFDAIIFTIIICNYRPRCAKEIADTTEIRIKKIFKMIEESKFSIHDLSRIELSNGNPRFNMPLELGMFLGAKEFGNEQQKEKVAIVLDESNYRYQATTSDIAGQDIKTHEKNPKKIIEAIREFLNGHHYKTDKTTIYGSDKIFELYNNFEKEKELIAKELYMNSGKLSYIDYLRVIELWQKEQFR